MFARDPLDEDAGFFWSPCRGNMRVQPPLTVKVATNARPGFINSASLALVTVLAQQVGCFLKPLSVDREYLAANRAGAALPPAQDYRLPIFSGVCHAEDRGQFQSMHARVCPALTSKPIAIPKLLRALAAKACANAQAVCL